MRLLLLCALLAASGCATMHSRASLCSNLNRSELLREYQSCLAGKS